jgi:hypothetical protein
MVLIYIVFFLRINLILELSNIHYAKSITILNTLTDGVTYIQPPVIVIEYDELSTSDIGKGTIVEVRIELNDHRYLIGICIDHIRNSICNES